MTANKLNVGCGRNLIPGRVNLDSYPVAGVVTEMIATLRAVKPIREPQRELQQPPTVYLLRP